MPARHCGVDGIFTKKPQNHSLLTPLHAGYPVKLTAKIQMRLPGMVMLFFDVAVNKPYNHLKLYGD
jgi:hypothetical protein